jgi:hypothetical protein
MSAGRGGRRPGQRSAAWHDGVQTEPREHGRSAGVRRRPRLPWSNTSAVIIDGNNLLHALSGGVDPTALRQVLARLRASLPSGIDGTIVLDGPPDPGGPMEARVGPGLGVRHSGRSTADQVIVASVEMLPFMARASVVVVTNDVDLRAQVSRTGARAEPIAWLMERMGSRPLDATPHPPLGSRRSSLQGGVQRTEPGAARPDDPRPGAARPRAAPPTVPSDRVRRLPRPRPEMPPDWESFGPPGEPSGGPLGAAGPGGAGGAPGPEGDGDRGKPWTPGRGATRKRGNPRRPPQHRGPGPAGS